MSNAMDMTLDDLIKKNKSSKPSSRSRAPRPSAPGGPTRRDFKRRGNRPAPYSSSSAQVEAPDGDWAHDMFADHSSGFPAQASAVRPAGIETGTKLFISNLDYGVSNEDIKELFAEVGDLKRFGVHYDRSGRSKGTADVVYARRSDALAAVKRYNNVQLDGKPMKIEIVGTNIPTPGAAPGPVGVIGNPNSAPRSGRNSGRNVVQGRGRARGIGRGARRGGRARGRGNRDEKVSADDLDADLEKYHSEAMQTN